METLDTLLNQHGDKVRAITNILVESPYFYRSDNENLFFFLRRYQQRFAELFRTYFGWSLLVDGKCARLYKERWYNERITPSNRELFDFTKRDECLGFMLLLEFFESQIDIQGVTVDERDNLLFRYGDLQEYVHARFQELFSPEKAKTYTEEAIRTRVLSPIMPKLERYRFLAKIPPPKDQELNLQDHIYEALPALYHYNANRLRTGLFDLEAPEDDEPAGDEIHDLDEPGEKSADETAAEAVRP